MLPAMRSNRWCGWIATLLALCACSITPALARSATSSAASAAQTANTLQHAVSESSSAAGKHYRSASTYLHAAAAADEPSTTTITADTAKSGGADSMWSELEFVYSTYQQCTDVDLSVCLKLKLVNALSGAMRSVRTLEPIEGIRFVSLKDEATAAERPAERVVSDEELLATLPRSVEGQEAALSTMIWDRVASFFQSHTVQIKFPTADELQKRAASAEGRDKDKKHHGYIMIPLLLGSTIIPIAYGALALLAGKALIVSKLALVLASIIGIKKLVSHSGDHGGGSRRISSSADGDLAAEWARKFELPHSLQQS